MGTTWGRLGDYLGTIWGFLGRDLVNKLFFCFFNLSLIFLVVLAANIFECSVAFSHNDRQTELVQKTRLDITVVEISKKCVEVSAQIF